MAVTTTTRLGLTRWSAGADAFTRVQMDDSHANLESRAAIYLQGTASARPAAGTVGRFHYATDTQAITYDDGTGWRAVYTSDTVTLGGTQTLTNKTLTSPAINGTVGGSAAYTGVTGLSTPQFVQFATSHSQAGAVGKVLWNDVDGTLEFRMTGGNVTAQVGIDVVARVRNATGSTLPKGSVVYVSGANGDRKQVSLATATTEAASSKTLGVLSEAIANGADGFCQIIGVIHGLNTSTYTVGQALWLSATPGGLTGTRPTFPNHAVFVGWVTRVHASNGEVWVNVQNGYELDELHDVVISSPVNRDILFHDGSKWINKPLSTALDGVSLTGTVVLPATTSIGTVSSTEIGYLDGVTSAIQTQLNGKPALNGTGATGTWPISVTGNAATATKWATARTITLDGAVTGSASVDGSANVTITTSQDSQPFVAAFMMAGLG